MLTETYIEALLVDESAADCVWEAWDRGEIDDMTAWWLWLILAIKNLGLAGAVHGVYSRFGFER